MVRNSYPEQQAFLSPEARRGTRIPLDNKSSRVLRQSISQYHGQSNGLQDELVILTQSVEQLKGYILGVPSILQVEDEQMHEIERYIKDIGM